jgi:hypothetical protein
MVVNMTGYGRLGNQLLHFASFIANSVENDYKLVYYGFDNYIGHFPYFQTANYNVFKTNDPIEISDRCTRNKMVKSALGFIYNNYKNIKSMAPFVNLYEITLQMLRLPEIGFDLNEPRFIERARRRLVFVSGWRFNDLQNMEKHKQLIREVFAPLPSVNEYIHTLIGYYKSLADLIIGVHIRRTDYKDYMNGKWFYELDVYNGFMEAISNSFRQEGKSVMFIICTDELIKKELFSMDIIFNEQTNFMIDLYSLASCDYIIGPPSTFSGWASYYGDVPIFYIEDEYIPPDFGPVSFGKGYHSWFCKSSTDMNRCLIG